MNTRVRGIHVLVPSGTRTCLLCVRGYQYPGLARVSISGVSEGINIRSLRGYQYSELARISISGVSEDINI